MKGSVWGSDRSVPVELHGGRIRAASEGVGHGATFRRLDSRSWRDRLQPPAQRNRIPQRIASRRCQPVGRATRSARTRRQRSGSRARPRRGHSSATRQLQSQQPDRQRRRRSVSDRFLADIIACSIFRCRTKTATRSCRTIRASPPKTSTHTDHHPHGVRPS